MILLPNKFFTQRGLSLPGIMIAVALIGASAVGIMQLMKINKDGTDGIRNRDAVGKKIREVQLAMSNPGLCQINFGGKSVDETITAIMNPPPETGNPEALTRVGDKIEGASFVLTEIKIERLDRLKRRGFVAFKYRHSSEALVVKEIKQYVRLFVEVNPAGDQIVRCLDPVTLSSSALISKMCWDADPENFNAPPNDNVDCTDNVLNLVSQMSEIYCSGNSLLTWDPLTKKCLPIDASVQCPAGSYVKGYNPAGQIICYTRPILSAPPNNLSLAHTPNNKNFTVSWTAGMGNGSCFLEYRNGASWLALAGTYNCDADAVNLSAQLPNDGWITSWSNLQVRLTRTSDTALMGIFPQNLTCASRSGSVTPTLNIDEDCNGYWDNQMSQWCYGDPPPRAIGAAYSVSDTYTCYGQTAALEVILWQTGNFDYRFYNAPGCVGFPLGKAVSATSTSSSGTVPAFGNEPTDFCGGPIDIRITTCQTNGIRSCIMLNALSSWDGTIYSRYSFSRYY